MRKRGGELRMDKKLLYILAVVIAINIIIGGVFLLPMISGTKVETMSPIEKKKTVKVDEELRETKSVSTKSVSTPANDSAPADNTVEPAVTAGAPSAEPPTPASDRKEGTVVAVDGAKLTLEIAGEQKIFTMDNSHVVTKLLNDKEAAQAGAPFKVLEVGEVKVGDKVIANTTGKGDIQSMVVQSK